MSIFIMNGKTFIKEFIKTESPDKILDSQYVLISNKIRKQGKFEKQVITHPGLYPNANLIIDYDDYNEPEYIDRYTEQVESHAAFLATIIEYVILQKETVIFLCAKTEWKYNFMQILQDYVYEKFEYPIYDYKKIKSGKEKEVAYDAGTTLKICDKVKTKAAKREREKSLNNERTRFQYIQNMTKKQMKKELKRIGYYEEGMDKEEMIETLDLML